MSPAGPTVIVTPKFMDRVSAVEHYLNRGAAARGREFVAALFDFIYETVAPFPLAFPAYTLPLHPELALRRAVFRRYYSLVYEVTTTEIRFVAFFATAQDASIIEV